MVVCQLAVFEIAGPEAQKPAGHFYRQLAWPAVISSGFERQEAPPKCC